MDLKSIHTTREGRSAQLEGQICFPSLKLEKARPFCLGSSQSRGREFPAGFFVKASAMDIAPNELW